MTDTPYIRPQFPVCFHIKLFATGWADEKLLKMKDGVTDIPNKPQKSSFEKGQLKAMKKAIFCFFFCPKLFCLIRFYGYRSKYC